VIEATARRHTRTRTRTRTHPEAAWQTAYMPTFYPPRLKKHTRARAHHTRVYKYAADIIRYIHDVCMT